MYFKSKKWVNVGVMGIFKVERLKVLKRKYEVWIEVCMCKRWDVLGEWSSIVFFINFVILYKIILVFEGKIYLINYL